MLRDLVPDFLAVLKASDRLAAYHRYLEAHRAVLQAYWRNYVIDLEGPHSEDLIRHTVEAERRDLFALLDCCDVAGIARDTIQRCEDLFEIDCPFEVYLMVGVGGANAGELVVGGRGIAFVCLEHFTGRPNPQTYGLGLRPELIRPWLAHEIAHVVRYGSPGSQSEMRRIVAGQGGFFDRWEAGSRAPLRELLVNEGLAVAASRQAAPGFEPWEYLGYGRRQYRRLRELEAFLTRHLRDELDGGGLGYQLRYLSGGTAVAQRLVAGRVIPERAGYYIGQRMVEALVAQRGIARALRASAAECAHCQDLAADQTA